MRGSWLAGPAALRRAARSGVALAAIGGLALSTQTALGFSGVNGRIAFTACDDDGCKVATMEPDGSDLRFPSTGGVPHWSADGRRLVFADDRSRPTPQVYAMDADGSNVRQVTHLTGEAADPSWSPDRTRITFENFPPHGTCCSQIWTVRADGSGLSRVTNFTRDVGPREPEYSPDGRWIAFFETNADRADLAAIYLVHPDGTGLRRVTPLELDAAHPSWSPDGSKIVFNDLWRQPVGDIFTIRPDGTDLTQLTFVAGSGGAWFRPAYSPDGTMIVFTEAAADGDVIAVMSAHGSDAHVVYSATFGFAPDWGPRP